MYVTQWLWSGQVCLSKCVLQVFLDLGDRYLVRPEVIKQGKLLGRGGFGFVFQGSCRNRLNGGPMDVALKMLQPVDPGPNARQSAIVAFKVCGPMMVVMTASKLSHLRTKNIKLLSG